MGDAGYTVEEISLWDCLHDGTLEDIVSDLLARTVTLIVDVPYIWQFHSMPESTRFHMVFEGVRSVIANKFAPWPGDQSIPPDLAWSEQHAKQQGFHALGRKESTGWLQQEEKLRGNEYMFSNASLTYREDEATFRCDVMDQDAQDYPEIVVRAEGVNFLLDGKMQLSRDAFLALGNAYWGAFAARKR